VFGNRACYRADLACLQSIPPFIIYERAMQELDKPKHF